MSGPIAPYAFVSYASADRARVLPLVAALQHAGVAVWLDRDGIPGGENYGRAIAQAIQGAAALVLMTSPLSLASRNVKQEIALAWEYARPYVPLLLEPVAIPDDVKYWLTAAQWVEVLDQPEADWLPAVLAALTPLGLIPPPAAPAPPERLPGREREQAVLRERLDAALGGRGGLVLVGGEAGVGKTTLVEATLAEATARGALTLTGRCYDLAETPPYGPWLEITARYPAAAPGLPPLPAAVTDRAALAAVASQAALFDQVVGWFAAVVAARPLVLLLDDLHWADPASLDLLRALARRAPALRLLLLATYRNDELTRRHPLAALLPLLEREAHAARLDPRRFDAEGVRDLVVARYPLPEGDADRLASWLHGRAEGNAFFTAQLLRALEDEGALWQTGDGWALGDLGAVGLPTPLRQVLDTRLARLGEESHRLLTLAAVIGQELPLALWATVAETDEDGLLDTIERAVDARLLAETPDGMGVRFAHALIREALYEGLLVVRRRRVHRRVGEALLAAPSPDPDAVAYHFVRAGDQRAAEWLIRAGERAQRAYAWLSAAERYEAALPLLDQEDRATGRQQALLLLTLAHLLRYHDLKRSLAYSDEARRLALAAGDIGLAAAAQFDHGHQTLFNDGMAAGLAEMAAALPALERLAPSERGQLPAQQIQGAAGTELYHRGALMYWLAQTGRLDEARALAAPMLARARRGPPRGDWPPWAACTPCSGSRNSPSMPTPRPRTRSSWPISRRKCCTESRSDSNSPQPMPSINRSPGGT